MTFRSLLFVPGDRPERFAKAAHSGADAMILDLEDSVMPAKKDEARAEICNFLASPRAIPCFVRLNPLDSRFAEDDLAVLAARPSGLVLPKVESPLCVHAWLDRIGPDTPPLLPIATETPAAVFKLGEYKSVASHLMGLTWGAEDLPAAMGAQSRGATGELTPTYQMIRSLTALGAHAAGVAAIDTVFPNIRDLNALARFVADGKRDGFTGMMALHPAQVPVINAGLLPNAEEVARAQRIVDAFEEKPSVGAFAVDGMMVDTPHITQAKALLERHKLYSSEHPV